MDNNGFSVFNFLDYPVIDKSNCVLHMSTFLSSTGYRRRGSGYRDFLCIKENIERFSNQPISSLKNFRLDLIISVNGDITEDEFIQYYNSIDKTTIGNNVNIKIFQRPNIGFQWGGFYDVWNKYKQIDCNWYSTIEADVYLDDDYWFDRCVDLIKDNSKVGFLGQNQDLTRSVRAGFEQYLNNKSLWRDKNNNPTKVNVGQLIHTRGGFYFCKKDFCQKMDSVFGCFTNATGCDYEMDGIIAGEVGFSQKATALGYSLFNEEYIVKVKG